jgi:RsiW-degrading membrane proteinase PrsW (M82 family)
VAGFTRPDGHLAPVVKRVMRWAAVPALVRGLPAGTLVGLIAIASFVVALMTGLLRGAERGALEGARALVESGKYEEAERDYLGLVEKEPGDFPLLLELLDNHESLVHAGEDEHVDATPMAESDRPRSAPPPPERDVRVEALLARIPPDAAMLAGYWHHVLRDTASEAERARVVAAADREPPSAWANHVLAREASRSGDRQAAAARFGREAKAFEGRRGDARLACDLWVALGDWPSVDAALADPRFERQLGPGDRFDLAAQGGHWTQALRWIVPAQADRATLGILLLAAFSAAVWFTICSAIGSPMPAGRRVPLHAAAFGLGIASTYLTIGVYAAEVHFVPSLGSTDLGSQALDCLVGVGPREEVAKGLLALPVLLWVKRWGRRRDALACGGLVGLGFAAAENVGYFETGLNTALVRFLTANLFHISATGLLAAAIDDALRGRSTKGNGVGWTLGFLVVMHGLYDLFALAPAQGDSAIAFLSLVPFVLVTRSFLSAVRELPRPDGRLQRKFVVGMALVAGATFVYASARVGPKHAGVAMAEGLLGTAIVLFMVIDELGSLAR